MIETSVLLSAAAVCAFGVMSPGPSFVAITYKALVATRPQVLALTAGIVVINAVWAASALFGIRTLLELFPWLFWSIKIAGASYLVWFGWRLLTRKKTISNTENTKHTTGKFAAFREGLLANLSNPKSMLFYTSIFSVSVPAQASLSLLLELVAVVFIVSAIWYGFLAMAMSSKGVKALYIKSGKYIERTCGSLLMLFGIKQVL